MPFKDTTEGQTHSYNDGCGMPEHNAVTPHNIIKKGREEFEKLGEKLAPRAIIN